jgi:hypothetical protein
MKLHIDSVRESKERKWYKYAEMIRDFHLRDRIEVSAFKITFLMNMLGGYSVKVIDLKTGISFSQNTSSLEKAIDLFNDWPDTIKSFFER